MADEAWMLCDESSLLDCTNARVNLGKSDCTHKQDAGVECDQTPVGKLPTDSLHVQRLVRRGLRFIVLIRED